MTMKKITLFMAVAAMFTACQEEPLVPEFIQESASDYIASIEDFGAATKTSMTETNRVVWNAGDELMIFQGYTLGDRYKVSDAWEAVCDNSRNLAHYRDSFKAKKHSFSKGCFFCVIENSKQQTRKSAVFLYNPVIFFISLRLFSASRGVREFISKPRIWSRICTSTGSSS